MEDMGDVEAATSLSGGSVELGSFAQGRAQTSSTKHHFVHKQQPMLVLEIKDDGHSDFIELRRDDILQVARSAVPDLDVEDSERLRRAKEELAELGQHLPPDMIKHMAGDKLQERVRFKGTLQHRDVRLLDPTFAHSRDPAILVRRHAILVNLNPIRALVLHNRVLVFVPDGADSLLSTLMTRLREASVAKADSYDAQLSFVQRSLEAIFVSICSELNGHARALEPKVHKTVKNVINRSSGVTIERLRQTKSDVRAVMSSVGGVQHAFEQLLTNDRDMALMKLDKVYASPEFFDERNAEQWVIDHEEIELLLENYAQAVDGIVSSLESLDSEIDSAMSTIALRLDTARNKLLGIDLLVSSVTSAAAIATLFAGLFGMNLESGVETDPYWFWGWFGAIVGGVPLMVGVMFYGIYRQGLLIT